MKSSTIRTKKVEELKHGPVPATLYRESSPLSGEPMFRLRFATGTEKYRATQQAAHKLYKSESELIRKQQIAAAVAKPQASAPAPVPAAAA